MIELEEVRWKNLLSTGNQFTTVNLKGARNTLICGVNAAGKSTIMDAICFALFGKPYRRINKPQLVNAITNKELVVEIDFKVDGTTYMIRRGLKPAVFEIYTNGNLVDQEADARDYQKVLEKDVLKIDFKTFCQKVIIGTANFVPFMQLNAADRRRIIEDLLDIQIFSQMNNILKSDAQEIKEKVDEVENNISLTQRTIELYEQHNKQVKEDNQVSIQEKLNLIKMYSGEIDRDCASLSELSATIEKARRVVSDRAHYEQQVKECEKKLAEIDAKIKQEAKFCQFLKDNSKCPTCAQPITEKHKMEHIGSHLQQIQDNGYLSHLKDTIKQANAKLKEYNDHESKITLAMKRTADITARINLNKRSISSLERDIENLKKAKEQIKDTDALKEQLVDLQREKQELLDERELYNIALVLLKDTGIKSTIIRQYVEVINKLINKYLAMMDFFCHFEVDENFKETIKARYRDELSYDSFSEGEKMRIDLALLFTWREIARMRNSSSVNLLVLDEIMDSSLDVSGTDDFLKIVRQLSEDNNVVVISHKTDQISDRFDRVIRFEKIKNFSRIQEAA